MSACKIPLTPSYTFEVQLRFYDLYLLLMYKTAVYRLVNVGITHQKQQISEKGDIARQYIDT